jgi:hypothetical protein
MKSFILTSFPLIHNNNLIIIRIGSKKGPEE